MHQPIFHRVVRSSRAHFAEKVQVLPASEFQAASAARPRASASWLRGPSLHRRMFFQPVTVRAVALGCNYDGSFSGTPWASASLYACFREAREVEGVSRAIAGDSLFSAGPRSGPAPRPRRSCSPAPQKLGTHDVSLPPSSLVDRPPAGPGCRRAATSRYSISSSRRRCWRNCVSPHLVYSRTVRRVKRYLSDPDLATLHTRSSPCR